jgi:hypothetical protein
MARPIAAIPAPTDTPTVTAADIPAAAAIVKLRSRADGFRGDRAAITIEIYWRNLLAKFTGEIHWRYPQIAASEPSALRRCHIHFNFHIGIDFDG